MRHSSSAPAGRVAVRILTLLALGAGVAAAEPPPSQHPRLLFTAGDVRDLRSKVRNGGDDDIAWNSIRAHWPEYQATPLAELLGPIAAINVICELGLLAHVDRSGAAEAKAADLALYIARTYPVDGDEFQSSLRLRTMALGYDMAFDQLSGAERAEMRGAMRSYLEFMPAHNNYYRYAHNPYASNKGATIGAAMGLAVMAMWEESTALERTALLTELAFGHALVEKCLDDMVATDGPYREGVLYGAWTMRMVIPYAEARRRFDGVDAVADPRIERMAEWLAYEVLPEGGGRTNNVNDSPWFSCPLAVHSTYLDWAQSRYGSALAQWLYDHVAGALGWRAALHADLVATVLWNQPSPPVDPGTLLPQSRLFSDRGLYAYRSAWNAGAVGSEVLFSLHAGRFLGGHAQEDQGQFTLYAHGDRYVVDNGAAYPTATPKQTESHNLILVDGIGQHNAGSSIGTDARIVSALLAPFCDWVHTDLDSAYETHSPFNDPDVPFPGTRWDWGYDGGNPLWRAQRTALIVKASDAPTWFLIADDFQKDASPHQWQWLLHTDAANTVDTSTNPVTIGAAGGRLLVWFARPQAPGLAVAAAPYENGGEDPSTVRLVAGVQAVEPGYAVVMAPLAWGVPAPTVTTAPIGRAARLRLAWGSATDDVVVNPTDSLVQSDLRTNGRLAVVRATSVEVTGWAIARGTRLERGPLLLAALERRASATLSLTTLHLDDADVGFMAWGPRVTRVVGPDGDRPFVRDGDWVRSPIWGGPRWRPSEVGFAIALDCAAGQDARLRVAVHDVRGRLVRVLDRGAVARAGRSLVWDGMDAGGARVAAGVYFARVRACGGESRRRILVVR